MIRGRSALFLVVVMTLLSACSQRPRVQAVAKLILVQPEWGGISGMGGVNPEAFKLCRSIVATISAPSFPREVLRSHPELSVQVSNVEVQYVTTTVEIRITASAEQAAVALQATQFLCDAVAKLVPPDAETKYSIAIRVMRAPEISAAR